MALRVPAVARRAPTFAVSAALALVAVLLSGCTEEAATALIKLVCQEAVNSNLGGLEEQATKLLDEVCEQQEKKIKAVDDVDPDAPSNIARECLGRGAVGITSADDQSKAEMSKMCVAMVQDNVNLTEATNIFNSINDLSKQFIEEHGHLEEKYRKRYNDAVDLAHKEAIKAVEEATQQAKDFARENAELAEAEKQGKFSSLGPLRFAARRGARHIRGLAAAAILVLSSVGAAVLLARSARVARVERRGVPVAAVEEGDADVLLES